MTNNEALAYAEMTLIKAGIDSEARKMVLKEMYWTFDIFTETEIQMRVQNMKTTRGE